MKTETPIETWFDVTEGRRGYTGADLHSLPRKQHGYESPDEIASVMAGNDVAYRVYPNRFGKFDMSILSTYYRLKRSKRSSLWVVDEACLESCAYEACARLGGTGQNVTVIKADEWPAMMAKQHLRLTGMR